MILKRIIKRLKKGRRGRLRSDEGWTLFQEMAPHDWAARPPNISKSSTPDELRTYAERAGFTDVRERSGSLWVTIVARKP